MSNVTINIIVFIFNYLHTHNNHTNNPIISKKSTTTVKSLLPCEESSSRSDIVFSNFIRTVKNRL